MSNEWISVKDRLPKKNGKYLCYNICLIGGIGIFSFAKNLKKVGINDFMFRKSGWYAYDSECGFYEVSNVTHWMPLPEPPKEDEREES